MTEIQISDKELLVNCGNMRGIVRAKLSELGFTRFGGDIVNLGSDVHMNTIFKLYPNRQDLLFKRFDNGWIPSWKKVKKILYRRFD